MSILSVGGEVVAGVAWIELHQSLPTHRKTLALADALGIEPVQAVGHLCCLWLWTLDNSPQGALLDVSCRTIARAAQWKKDPVVFVDALVQAGLLDEDHHVHDWDDYAGKLTDQRELRRESNRRAQSARRQRLRDADCHHLSAPSQHIVSADKADNQQSTVPDLTGPNRTVVCLSVSHLAGARANGVPPEVATRLGQPPIGDGQTDRRRMLIEET